MKLGDAFGILGQLRFCLSIALLPTLKEILASPSLLFRPRLVSRLYMANIWMVFGDGIDENSKATRAELITPNAHGVVLDIGAGHGHAVQYFERPRVTQYIALEPNVLMHEHIRAQANKAGFHEADGTLVILSCGAEDTQGILSRLNDGNSNQGPPVDTVISILTLCSIPDPQRSVARLVRDVLKSRGQFLMHEHVLSKRSDVAWWQRLWAPLWSLGFDGCRMDRPTDVWVHDLKEDKGGESAWKESRIWWEGNDPDEGILVHKSGRFVKN